MIRWRYNKKDDVLRIRLSDEPIARTLEVDFGLVDIDAEGEPVQVVIYAVTKEFEVREQRERVGRPAEQMTDDLTRSVTAVVNEARDEVPIPG